MTTTDPLPVEQIDDLWLELCEYTDRTSPEEYPDHALITRDELADFIGRATRPQHDREAIADVERFRALLIPATRTVYKTADVRAKSLARATIAKELPALLEEVEQLRAANRIQAKATELWMARAHHAEHRLATELGEPDDDC